MSRIRKGSGCPLCHRPVAEACRPFCSPACKDRDLLKWLGGDYRVPGPVLAEDELESLDTDRLKTDLPEA